MELNQNITDDSQEIVNTNEKVILTENLNYLYPNGHRTTHQMRWFKGSRNRGLRSDMAAWKRQNISIIFIIKEMRKNQKNQKINPDPYEDIIRLEQLDPYESLIKANNFLKKNNKSIY